jgi:hypothetical protein
MGNFTPPAFATVPTHVSCGAFACPQNSILPLKASRASPSEIFHLFFQEEVIDFFWKYSLQDLKLKEHDCTKVRCGGCPKRLP